MACAKSRHESHRIPLGCPPALHEFKDKSAKKKILQTFSIRGAETTTGHVMSIRRGDVKVVEGTERS